MDGTTSITLYQRRCDDKINMVPNFDQDMSPMTTAEEGNPF